MMSFEELRIICLSWPDVKEEPHFEKTSFRIKKKIFLSHKSGSGRITVKLSTQDQDLFGLPDRSVVYPVSNKWGLQGWTIVELTAIPSDFLLEIVETAFKTVAKVK
jgi:predicted DNA-binding protein (MmcQ/YjbR family)